MSRLPERTDGLISGDKAISIDYSTSCALSFTFPCSRRTDTPLLYRQETSDTVMLSSIKYIVQLAARWIQDTKLLNSTELQLASALNDEIQGTKKYASHERVTLAWTNSVVVFSTAYSLCLRRYFTLHFDFLPANTLAPSSTGDLDIATARACKRSLFYISLHLAYILRGEQDHISTDCFIVLHENRC
jgi:hypothetical protein